jgi:hypothetical protein
MKLLEFLVGTSNVRQGLTRFLIGLVGSVSLMIFCRVLGASEFLTGYFACFGCFISALMYDEFRKQKNKDGNETDNPA